MLTLPDMKSKQVLFIQMEPKCRNRLFFRNENIVFERDGKIINQASCHRVLAVFMIGDFTFTSGLVRECRKRGVSLFFLGYNFRVYGFLDARGDGNYLLRMAQYQLSEENEFIIAKNLVQNKIINQTNLINSIKQSEYEATSEMLPLISRAKSGKELLGIEGNFSRLFFNEYFKEMDWFRRLPRVKPDINNLLLDVGYTFLFNFIDSLLLLFGFDTYKGCYHKLFFQRKSLTCDIMEPFRCIIEKQLLKSFHLKQIDKKDFFLDQGHYSLQYRESQKYAKIFMEAIMDHRESIYLFVYKFYRFMMDGTNPFPSFNILTKEVK